MESRIHIRNKSLWAAGLFLAVFGVYLWSCAAFVSYEDAGELATASYRLGIMHPPGNPLFPLVSKPFFFILAGFGAFRGGLCSAWFGAAGIIFLLLVLWRLGSHQNGSSTNPYKSLIVLLGVAATGLWAFAPTFFSQVRVPEIYPLETAFLFGILALIIGAKKANRLALAFLAWVFGLTLHLPLGLLILGAIYYLVFERISSFPRFASNHTHRSQAPLGNDDEEASSQPQKNSNKKFRFLPSPRRSFVIILFLAFLFCLGLTLYLFLPLRSAANPVLNWGNPQTWALFKSHVTGERLLQWASRNRHPELMDYLKFMLQLLRQFVTQFGWFGGVMLLWGMIRHRDKKAAFGLFFAGLYCGIGVIFMAGDDYKPMTEYMHRVLYLPAFALWFPLIFMGIADAARLLSGAAKSLERPVKILAPMALAGLVLVLLIQNIPDEKTIGDTRVRDMAAAMTRDLPPDAIFLTGSSIYSFPILYLAAVQGTLNEKNIYDLDGNVFYPLWESTGEYSAREYMTALTAVKKLINTKKSVFSNIRFEEQDLVFIPDRWKYVVKMKTKDDSEQIAAARSSWPEYQIESFEAENDDADYPQRELQGLYYLRLAEAAIESGDSTKAVEELARAEKICVGIISCQLQRLEMAFKYNGYFDMDRLEKDMAGAEPGFHFDKWIK